MQPVRMVNVIVHRTWGPRFLLLRRVATRDDPAVWQTVTGAVEESDATLADAALREVAEGTGITRVLGVRDLGHSHTFEHDGRVCVEHAFGVEVPADADVRLTDAHDLGQWVEAEEALGLIQWPANRTVFMRLVQALDKEDATGGVTR